MLSMRRSSGCRSQDRLSSSPLLVSSSSDTSSKTCRAQEMQKSLYPSGWIALGAGKCFSKRPGHASALSSANKAVSADVRFSRSVFANLVMHSRTQALGHNRAGLCERAGACPLLAEQCNILGLMRAGGHRSSLNGCCQSPGQPHQEVQLLIPVQDPLPALLRIR